MIECDKCNWFSRLKDTKGLARSLEVGVKVIRHLRDVEGLPSFLVGGTHRYDLHEVREFLMNRRKKT